MVGQFVGGSEFGAVVGTGGGGNERRVCVLGLSVTVSDARASHLLYWAVVYRFDFRLLFGRLCFALCSISRLFILLNFDCWLDRLCFALA